jgi:hypothetical protein
LKFIVQVISAVFVAWMSIAPLHAMDFIAHPNNKSQNLLAVLATGEIKKSDVEKLDLYISGQPKRKQVAVYLGSEGGDLYEGMRLGLYFKANRIKTSLEGGMICASACALAFLGGTDSKGKTWRSSSTNARLGFHAFRNANGSAMPTDDVQAVVADILVYGKRVDAPLELLIANFMTPSDQIAWISDAVICQLGIKLWNVEADRFDCI